MGNSLLRVVSVCEAIMQEEALFCILLGPSWKGCADTEARRKMRAATMDPKKPI